VAAVAFGHLFVQSAVEKMLGLIGALPDRAPARLTGPVEANGPRTHYVRARIEPGANGWRCTPFARQDSSLLTVLAAANGLMVRAPDDPPRFAGDLVEFVWTW